MEAMKYYENDITIRSVHHQSSLLYCDQEIYQHAHSTCYFLLLLFFTVHDWIKHEQLKITVSWLYTVWYAFPGHSTVLVGPICLAHSQTNIYLHLCCYSVLVVHLKKCFLNRSCSLQLPIIPLHCPSYSRNINCVRHGYVARLSSSRDFTL